MKSYPWLTIILLVFISCSSEPEVEKSDYAKFMANIESIAIAESVRVPYEESQADFPLNLTSNGEHVVVVNAKTWKLYLMDTEGIFSDSAGGLGRGPGEFSGINYIHIGTDNRLYVYDGLSKKVTVYSITNEALELEDEVVLPPNDMGLSMKSIYKTATGYVGVFLQLFGTPDDEKRPFYVYSLGDDLELQERLLELPGNDFFISDRPVRTQRQNHVGDETAWGMAGGQFFYTVNNDLSVWSVNMLNDSSTTYDFSDVPKPIKGEEEITAIEKSLELLIESQPIYKELIREGEYLRYFTHFIPTQNYFYYKLNTPGAEESTLLRIDKETKEFKKIMVPVGFVVYAARGDMLFGIDHTTGGASEIMFLQLESQNYLGLNTASF